MKGKLANGVGSQYPSHYLGKWWGNPTEGDNLEGSGIYGRIIFIWIFRKWDVGRGLD